MPQPRSSNYCCVPNCGNKGSRGFYSFPVDPIMREKWRFATGRTDTFCSSWIVCHIHFCETDFRRNKNTGEITKRKLLIKDVIPHINVPYPPDVPGQPVEECAEEEEPVEDVDTSESDEGTIPKENNVPYRDFPCGLCGKVFISPHMYQEHFSLIHPDMSTRQLPKPVSASEAAKMAASKIPVAFQCGLCGRLFKCQSEGENHMESHKKCKTGMPTCNGMSTPTPTNEEISTRIVMLPMPVEEPTIVPMLTNLEPVSSETLMSECQDEQAIGVPKAGIDKMYCPFHQQCFRIFSFYIRHMNRQHSYFVEISWHKCQRCKFYFPTEKAVEYHNQRTHLNPNRFPCLLCGAIFPLKIMLTDHLEYQHDLQPDKINEIVKSTLP